MANKLIYTVLAVAVYLALFDAHGALADCPSASKVLNCTPKCLHDTECSALGGKCCPNLCNQRSCLQPNQVGNSGSNSSPFDKKSGGSSGSYCGNVKCSTSEKCVSDRSTKRPACVRT